MLERREFARRHRSSSLSFSLSLSRFFLLQAPAGAADRSLPPARVHACTAYVHVCVRACECARTRADISKRDADIRSYTYRRTHARTHAGRHSCGPRLILLEATDAPISVRVSFVIRENVNQSPGPRRLLLLRGSSLSLHPLRDSRTYTRVCVRIR